MKKIKSKNVQNYVMNDMVLPRGYSSKAGRR